MLFKVFTEICLISAIIPRIHLAPPPLLKSRLCDALWIISLQNNPFSAHYCLKY